MAELLYNAWSGWSGYTDRGKMPALLLAVLLFLWFGRRQREQKALLVYTSFMTVCCIFPVTAALLMLYQTKFYNYEWIWSFVPMTAVIAWGITLFWTEYRAGNVGRWKRLVPMILLLLTVVGFCGSMGRQVREEQREQRNTAHAVLDQIMDKYPEAELCLWAPREIMEYAREKDASIRLPYGRNIWDGFLNAYSYDVYTEDVLLLEQWMQSVGMAGESDQAAELNARGADSGNEALEGQAGNSGNTEGQEAETASRGDREAQSGKVAVTDTGDGIQRGEQSGITLETCVEIARRQGVNCILLAKGTSAGIVSRMEKALNAEAEELEGYYLFLTDTEDIYE